MPNYKEIIFNDFCAAMLWAETGFNDENEESFPLEDKYSISDIKNPDTIRAVIDTFIKECESQGILIHKINEFQPVGHDLYLTIAHHGAGFWDGDYDDPDYIELGDKLTDICKDIVRYFHTEEDGEGVFARFSMNPEFA